MSDICSLSGKSRYLQRLLGDGKADRRKTCSRMMPVGLSCGLKGNGGYYDAAGSAYRFESPG
jgi:hypothetical protein